MSNIGNSQRNQQAITRNSHCMKSHHTNNSLTQLFYIIKERRNMQIVLMSIQRIANKSRTITKRIQSLEKKLYNDSYRRIRMQESWENQGKVNQILTNKNSSLRNFMTLQISFKINKMCLKRKSSQTDAQIQTKIKRNQQNYICHMCRLWHKPILQNGEYQIDQIVLQNLPLLFMNKEPARIKCKSQSKNELQVNKTQKLLEYLKEYELPLFEAQWSIYQQLIMLDGLQIFGCENWEKVTQYMRTNFTSEEVRDHYYNFYCFQSQDCYLPPIEQMFIAHENDDIYIASQKKDHHRLSQEQRQQKKRKNSDSDSDDFNMNKKQDQQNEKTKLKIPHEFGYESYKKIFAQPFNEQAEIMLLGLDFKQTDSNQLRQSKLKVLREYHRLIMERNIVQNKIMDQNLMECKYSLTSSDLIFKGFQNNSKEQLNQNKKHEKQKPKSQPIRKQSLFFRIKRRPNEDLCQELQVPYMKASKFDNNENLKNLLKKYQSICNSRNNFKKSSQQKF